MTAFWSGTIFLFYGCVSLHRELTSQFEGISRPIGGIEIPILGMELSVALLIAAGVFAGAIFLFYRLSLIHI